MTDYTELKRLAEAALRNWPDSKLLERPECERFIDAARPDVVLALITENDRLNTECKQLILLEHNGGTVEAATNLLAERDQLKAEQASLNAQVDTLTEWYLNALKDAEAICKDCDQLRAEVAGLRTGYEACERVNAELKAECARSTEREILQLAEIEALRNALRPLLANWDDLRPGESLSVDAARAAMGQGEKS